MKWDKYGQQFMDVKATGSSFKVNPGAQGKVTVVGTERNYSTGPGCLRVLKKLRILKNTRFFHEQILGKH